MAGLRDGIASGGGSIGATTGTFSGNVTLGDASGDAITVTGTMTCTPTAVFTGGVTLNNDSTTAAGKGITLGTTGKTVYRSSGIYINSGAAGKLTIAADGSGADDLTLSCSVAASDNIRMATTKKVEFTDANVYIQASAASKLKAYSAGTGVDAMTLQVGSGGTVAVTGHASISGDLTLTGHKDGQVLLINGNSGFDDASDGTELWYNSADGLHLAASQTAQIAYFPVEGLKVGDEVTGYAIFGKVTSGGNAVTVDAKLTKVNKDGTNSDITGGAITQVSQTTNFTYDSSTAITAEVAAVDYAYHIIVTGTTGAACTIDVTGIQLNVNRK